MGEMCWLAPNNGDGTKILHLRLTKCDRWLPYTSPQFAHLRQSDTVLPGLECSKGYRTAQYLLSRNWSYVPSEQTYSNDPELAHGKWSMAAAVANAKERGLVQ